MISSPPTNASAPAQFLDYEKSLACIHCGLCLSSCPTYLETGNENDSPRGRIYLMRALQDGRTPLSDATVRHVDLCLGCRACEAVCPSGVQYGALLEGTRDHVEHQHGRSVWQRFLRRVVIEKIFPFPERMELALIPARWVQRLHLQRWLPGSLRELLALVPEDASNVSLPVVSPTSLRPVRGRVGFVSGCVMSVIFGETNRASVRLLNRCGYDVITPPEQGCCGALYAHGGNLEMARAAARRNIAVFEQLNLDAVLINAAGCGSMLKEYGHLLVDDPAWASRSEAFARKVRDLAEWLREHAGELFARDAVSSVTNVTTYHDACHLAHAQRIEKQPRELVRAAAGGGFVEMAESNVCCGSAGSYNLTEPAMAKRLQERKTVNILNSGAKVVVTSNPGCLLQIRAGLKAAGREEIEVLHIADYLERCLGVK